MQRLFIVAMGLVIFLVITYGGFRFLRWWPYQGRRWLILLFVVILALPMSYAGYRVIRWWRYSGGDITSLIGEGESPSNTLIAQWLSNPTHRAASITRPEDVCPDAPFILPSIGYIGLLWRDSAPPYTPSRRHTGLDIFGDGAVGTVPIVAVYDGWLTRQSEWKSTLIIRHRDPLQSGRTIWSYYTHMADVTGTQTYISDAFPPGISERFVKQGTRLGYQGLYAGSGPAIAMHVHLSLVRDDGTGKFLNEAVLENTIDPSPYFELALNIDQKPSRPIRCHR